MIFMPDICSKSCISSIANADVARLYITIAGFIVALIITKWLFYIAGLLIRFSRV